MWKKQRIYTETWIKSLGPAKLLSSECVSEGSGLDFDQSFGTFSPGQFLPKVRSVISSSPHCMTRCGQRAQPCRRSSGALLLSCATRTSSQCHGSHALTHLQMPKKKNGLNCKAGAKKSFIHFTDVYFRVLL